MNEGINLDLVCAKYGSRLTDAVCKACLTSKSDRQETETQRQENAAKTAENLITRMLGVLQGQGIYAMFLLLAARKETGSQQLGEAVISAIKEAASIDLGMYSTILETFKPEKEAGGLLANIPQMLLAKRVMEQTLVYARYHAKAKAGGANG